MKKQLYLVIDTVVIDLDVYLVSFSAAANDSGVFPKILAANWLPPKGDQIDVEVD